MTASHTLIVNKITPSIQQANSICFVANIPAIRLSKECHRITADAPCRIIVHATMPLFRCLLVDPLKTMTLHVINLNAREQYHITRNIIYVNFWTIW